MERARNFAPQLFTLLATKTGSKPKRLSSSSRVIKQLTLLHAYPEAKRKRFRSEVDLRKGVGFPQMIRRPCLWIPGVEGGGGVYSWDFLVGASNPDPISDQNCNLPHPFSDQAFRQKLCYCYLDWGANKNSSSNSFRIRIFFFLSYSPGIETINTFIHSRSSLKNHTRFQTKIGKVYTRFQTTTVQKTLPDGAAHTYIAYVREYPPGHE